MFGYVLPRRDRLDEAQRSRYAAAYCGLCRSLKESFGFSARFLVNYDMVFLYFVLNAGREESSGRCRCPARFGCKKTCVNENDTLRYAAELSVLLSCWKLRDACEDGRFRVDARLALLLYRRSYRRAAARLPEIDRLLNEKLSALHALERAKCASLDRTADTFAALLRGFAEGCPESERRATEMLLYHIGRYLYLVDALDDLPKDVKHGAYNPLRYRYTLMDGALSAGDRAALIDSIEASISLAASALELLPAAAADPIVRNIVYLGLPAVLHGVAAGTFRKRTRRSRQ